MRPTGHLGALLEFQKLKDLARTGWVLRGVDNPESVAAHSWGVGLLAAILSPPKLNRVKILEMAIIHDLAEVRTGDRVPDEVPDRKKKAEEEACALSAMLEPIASDVSHRVARLEEMEAGTSPEARFIRACDRLDMALQAANYALEGRLSEPNEFFRSAKRTIEMSGYPDILHLLDELEHEIYGKE